MMCFSIGGQSFNEVKNMAGNIVPAIASTNSIVSGLQVVEMIKLFGEDRRKLRSYYVQNQSYKVRALRVEKPLPSCAVCSALAQPLTFELDMATNTLQGVIDRFSSIAEGMGVACEFSVNQGEKELYNSEEPNERILKRTLLELSGGAFEMDLVVTDEDSSLKICSVWVVHTEGGGFEVRNEKHLQLQKEENARRQAEEGKEAATEKEEQDGEVVVMGREGESGDEVEVTEVRRAAKQPEPSEEIDMDKVEKRVKYT